MAYWEKQGAGWRALAYKRAPAQVARAADAGRPASCRKQIVAAAADAAAIERNRESLAEAERSFSRDAQTMGIGAAFKKYGSPDAANFGGPDVPTFVFGQRRDRRRRWRRVAAEHQRRELGAGEDDHRAERRLRRDDRLHRPQRSPGADGKIPPGQPFFTIWRRDASGAWRYIAE